MKKNKSLRMLVLNLLLIFTLMPVSRIDSVRAQEDSQGVQVEAGTAEAVPSGEQTMQWSAEMPVPSAEQQAQLSYWSEHTNLPGPQPSGAELQNTALPAVDPASASNPASQTQDFPRAPLAPGSAQIYKTFLLGSTIPAGFKSNVMESSVNQAGLNIFATGNWFATRSKDGGSTWAFVNPFSGMSDFCCDQVTTYDEARRTVFWLRMGIPGTNPNNGNYENRFVLGVSTDGASNFCNYSFYPTGTNGAWTNQWWDYPHIQLGADYMYIAWNLFNQNDVWQQTVMLRFPLDSLETCSGFSYNYYATNSWFTFVPVQGAEHSMYFASNWPITSPFDRLLIARWDEDSTNLSLFTRTVAAWSLTARGQAVCGASANWAGRTDHRLLTGARYRIYNTNLKYYGRNVIGWWWNVKQGGNFAMPYIDGAAFFEDTMTQVPGLPGRPFVWNSSTCFLYPSAAANRRGDVALLFHTSAGLAKRPAVSYAIADDYTAAPPGWFYFTAMTSNARPSDNKWGDYNTLRSFIPSQDTWTAASHYIPGATNCTNCSAPIVFNFGRSRDFRSWFRWRNK